MVTVPTDPPSALSTSTTNPLPLPPVGERPVYVLPSSAIIDVEPETKRALTTPSLTFIASPTEKLDEDTVPVKVISCVFSTVTSYTIG